MKKTVQNIILIIIIFIYVTSVIDVFAISTSSSLNDFQTYALNNWARPIKASILSVPNTGRAFGASRSNGRTHAGVDWYVINGHGTPVYSMTNGIVIEYSPNFYAGTQAIAVKNNNLR